MIGRTLSHYRISARLGEGGMGEVFLAWDSRLERRVALKLLPQALSGDADRLRRLREEARALAALDHPGIVPVYSFERDGDLHFLTMAYVDGERLDRMIPERGLPVPRLLDLAICLADALRAAHGHGVIHRDLKPANVMLDREGRLRVLDFGLAKRGRSDAPDQSQLPTRDPDRPMTEAGTIIGSWPYMSPEQAEGLPLDARSDIFSLGVMFYEMACGRRPFRGDTRMALLSSILRDEPAPPGSLRAELPPGFDAVVARCLEKRPKDRYAGAEELLEDLQRLRQGLSGGTASGTPGTVAPPAGRWARRRGILGAAGAAVLVVAAAAAGAAYLWPGAGSGSGGENPSAGGAPSKATIAVLPLENLSGDPAQDYLVDGMTDALIADLGRIGALSVISRTSSMRYRDSKLPASRIAGELHADHLVEGSVMREGDRVALTVQLIDAREDRTLWSDRFEREVTSVLSLQRELAQAIARGVSVAVTPRDRRVLAGSGRIAPEAHEAYLKGMYHLQKFTGPGFELARRYFDSAAALDPESALPLVGQAMVAIYGNQLGLLEPRLADARVTAAVSRALEIDDELPEAHFARAVWKVWHDYDWPEGERSFRRALDLNPSHSDAHALQSHFLSLRGRFDEGKAEMDRAIALDPVNPFYRDLQAVQLALSGRPAEAVTTLEATLAVAPGSGLARKMLPYFLADIGRRREAVLRLAEFAAQDGDAAVARSLRQGLASGGERAAWAAAARLWAGRAEESWVQPTLIADLFDLAGETGRALDWLERAERARDPDLPYIGVLYASRELRSDPRFTALLSRLDLPRDLPRFFADPVPDAQTSKQPR